MKDAHGKTTQQKEVIHTNEKHPFLTKEKGFIPVSQLQPGMHVRQADGSYGVVTKVVIVPGAMWMYNLTVAQDHTYTVGLEQWIVHNATNCGGNNQYAQNGNRYHYDQVNGGPPGSIGGPSQLQQMYPQTQFNFAPRGAPGADVQFAGGVHLLMLLFIQTLHGLIGAILLILSRIHQEAGGNLPMRLITVSFHRTQYQFGTTQYSL